MIPIRRPRRRYISVLLSKLLNGLVRPLPQLIWLGAYILGFKPHAITYSSDNFDRLYAHAEQLITLQKAYVCHCPDTELKLQRGGEKGTSPRYRCQHAEQDVETNLQKFRDMRDGKYKPQAAFLRFKQDIESGNPQNWYGIFYHMAHGLSSDMGTGI
jgi:glutamyl/glutaminyl-tRNA synthetase